MGWFIISRALVVRILFAFHGFLTIYLLTVVSEDPNHWYATTSLTGLLLETGFTIYVRKGQEWKWFCPSVLFYLLSVVPPIWLLELHELEERIMEELIRQNSTNVFHNVSDDEQIADLLDKIKIPIKFDLTSEQVVRMLEQLLLLFLILGRWILPKGQLTHDQLSELLLVYIATAADIVEFFDAFKEDAVRFNRPLCIVILSIWSWSLLQFTMVLTATKKPKDVAPPSLLSIQQGLFSTFRQNPSKASPLTPRTQQRFQTTTTTATVNTIQHEQQQNHQQQQQNQQQQIPQYIVVDEHDDKMNSDEVDHKNNSNNNDKNVANGCDDDEVQQQQHHHHHQQQFLQLEQPAIHSSSSSSSPSPDQSTKLDNSPPQQQQLVTTPSLKRKLKPQQLKHSISSASLASLQQQKQQQPQTLQQQSQQDFKRSQQNLQPQQQQNSLQRQQNSPQQQRRPIMLPRRNLLVPPISLGKTVLKGPLRFGQMAPKSPSLPPPVKLEPCFTPEVFGIVISMFLQDAPFLVLRLLLIFQYDVVSYTNMFFTCKNTLVCMLLTYRLVVIQIERCRPYCIDRNQRRRAAKENDNSGALSGLVVSLGGQGNNLGGRSGAGAKKIKDAVDLYYKYSTKVNLREYTGGGTLKNSNNKSSSSNNNNNNNNNKLGVTIHHHYKHRRHHQSGHGYEAADDYDEEANLMMRPDKDDDDVIDDDDDDDVNDDDDDDVGGDDDDDLFLWAVADSNADVSMLSAPDRMDGLEKLWELY